MPQGLVFKASPQTMSKTRERERERERKRERERQRDRERDDEGDEARLGKPMLLLQNSQNPSITS